MCTDNTVKNNYVLAEKNRGNAIDKKYMIVDKVLNRGRYPVRILQDK